jgi:hypothetical protein
VVDMTCRAPDNVPHPFMVHGLQVGYVASVRGPV